MNKLPVPARLRLPPNLNHQTNVNFCRVNKQTEWFITPTQINLQNNCVSLVSPITNEEMLHWQQAMSHTPFQMGCATDCEQIVGRWSNLRMASCRKSNSRLRPAAAEARLGRRWGGSFVGLIQGDPMAHPNREGVMGFWARVNKSQRSVASAPALS